MKDWKVCGRGGIDKHACPRCIYPKRKLNSPLYAEIAGGERGPLDRITFNPRMMVNTTALDLTTRLFGDDLFAPILIGPIADQKRYHPEGELVLHHPERHPADGDAFLKKRHGQR